MIESSEMPRKSGIHPTLVVADCNSLAADLKTKAREELVRAFGEGGSVSAGSAPGRVPLVGDHVDYVGGRVACVAIDLNLAVALRASPDGMWRAASNGRVVERKDPNPCGDIGDRIFASVLALQPFMSHLPPIEVGVAANLPESAGLSSSAAIVVAVMVGLLRMADMHMSAFDMVNVALTAEREIVGVPCGSLDQQAIVHAPAHGVLILDFADDSFSTVPWPWPRVGIVVADSGDKHDVAAGAYADRRRQAELVLTNLGVTSCQEIDTKWSSLTDPELRRRGRHISTETVRTDRAVECLRAGDLDGLGGLISMSHASLRDDFQVSTDRIDAMVEAATRLPGCYGSRIVGGGFGGSAIALCDEGASDSVRRAMAGAAGRTGVDGTWTVHPSPGIALSAPDVIVGAASHDSQTA